MNKEIKIMIVDPEEESRLLIAEFLDQEYNCVTAIDTADATKLLLSQSFNLVLASTELEDGTASDLYNEVRDWSPDTSFVTMGETGQQAAAGGSCDNIPRPMDLCQVMMVVERVLFRQSASSSPIPVSESSMYLPVPYSSDFRVSLRH